ncbi:MAG TPA: hypothetical protein VNH11_13820 [Pirellulales bacterium]|nr:hypothetical protein [Pirellulales bacterium]
MRPIIAALTAFVVAAAASAASAQAIVYETYSPLVVQSPVVYETWRPAARNYNYNPPVSSPNFTGYTSNYGNYAATTTYYAYSPVTTYSPVVTETVTAYSPVATTAYSPVATTTYSPAVTTYSPVLTAPVVAAPVVTSYYTPVVVRPRYFVPGEPVRNFFRALGP